MIEKEKIPVKIIGNPIHRELDGLAMSSRNVRLTPEQRKVVPFIYKTLQKAKENYKTQSPQEVIKEVESAFATQPLLQLEYFTIANETNLLPITKKNSGEKARAFIAVFVGNIRLIDNIQL